MDGGKSMNDETKTKLPRKRWKRALKWTIGVVLIALLVRFEIAYGRSTNDCELYSAAPTNTMMAVVYCHYGVPNLCASARLEQWRRNRPALRLSKRLRYLSRESPHYKDFATKERFSLGRRS